MRTQSSAKVKHSRTSRAHIDHCSRALRDALCMSDECDDALEDGRYDAFILSADTRDDGVAISCTITAGSHRGDVVDLVSKRFATRDPFELVGVPCTLVVSGNEIRIEQ
jgi:hypothetical protein